RLPSYTHPFPTRRSSDLLIHDTTHSQFLLTDTNGNKILFYDFSTSWLASQRGQFQSLTDPEGNVTSVTSRTSAGKPAEVQRSTRSEEHTSELQSPDHLVC